MALSRSHNQEPDRSRSHKPKTWEIAARCTIKEQKCLLLDDLWDNMKKVWNEPVELKVKIKP